MVSSLFDSSEEVLITIKYLCVLNLVMTIFRVTAQDIKYGDEETKREALIFLESEWFEEMCCNMGLDYKRVKKLISSKSKVSPRSVYE
jgi:hypothetical protein